DFKLTGDPAALARLLVARGLRRRFGRRVAAVQGKRDRVAALDALIATELTLDGLHRSGVRFEPRTVLSLLAHLIEPAWTEGERFSLVYRTPEQPAAYLVIGDRRRIEVTETRPGQEVTTKISGPPGSLELILAGRPDGLTRVSGDSRPLSLVRSWIKRAQSE
ncbi:MAG: hypothetical protein M3016_10205, partial [Actinomycetota bacterium]|nr:hypothetical protein [Actinomycetota bacterium]